MAEEHRLKHVNRTMTDPERQEAAKIHEAAMQDFPPKDLEEPPVPSGLPRQIHDARQQRRMTRYELGQRASVPSTIVRAIEQGEDVPLSQFHAVAAALGLTIELVEQR
jgi:ribosome-binding protein aMBF1 (putative translation factor)